MRQGSVRRLPLNDLPVMSRSVLVLLCAVVVTGQRSASAQATQGEGQSIQPEYAPSSASPYSDTTHRLEWQWKRVHWAEVLSTVSLTAGAVAIGTTVQPTARWTSTNEFDNFFYDRLKLQGDSRERVSKASDAFALSLIAFPVLVDSIGVAMIGDKNMDVAGQLLAIQAQAFAMTGFLTAMTKNVAGRVRPHALEEGCANGDASCGNSAYESYFSGHTAFAFTGAGLTCVEHRHLKLFGRAGDGVACGGALTLASATALFRVMSDSHWATDVLTGAGVGLVSGWLMPWLMHFRHDAASKRDGGARALHYISPYGSASQLGISAAGSF